MKFVDACSFSFIVLLYTSFLAFSMELVAPSPCIAFAFSSSYSSFASIFCDTSADFDIFSRAYCSNGLSLTALLDLTLLRQRVCHARGHSFLNLKDALGLLNLLLLLPASSPPAHVESASPMLRRKRSLYPTATATCLRHPGMHCGSALLLASPIIIINNNNSSSLLLSCCCCSRESS